MGSLRALGAPFLILLVMLVPASAVPFPTSAQVTAAEVTAQMPGPAEQMPVAEESDDGAPWTSRFLIPTVLAMTVAVLLLVVLGYGARISGRYRVRR